jgi:O-acetyl-ADP-ribose deacetylase (regulator of RNase III)
MELPHDGNYFVDVHLDDPLLVRILRGDITKSSTDAIVNAANSMLLAGGGVCGAIHRAAGPAIADECRRISNEHGPISPGHAVATRAGLLPAEYVIHAVGPIWRGGDGDEAETLASCYRESMRIADELKLKRIAFPAISTGVFGYPVKEAGAVAIPTIVKSLVAAKHLVLVEMVLFDKPTLDSFAALALEQPDAYPSKSYYCSIGQMPS